MKIQMEKLQCILTCEVEKRSNVQIDLSVKESDLKDCQQQYTTLSDELKQLKQQHKEKVRCPLPPPPRNNYYLL